MFNVYLQLECVSVNQKHALYNILRSFTVGIARSVLKDCYVACAAGTTMNASDKVKIVADREPEEVMTSSSSSGRPVSWLHLCVIYGLLGIYGLWAATSYQLMRSSLLDELKSELSQRRSAVAEGLDRRRLADIEDLAAVRRRRSADEPLSEGGDVEHLPVLSRVSREATVRRRGDVGRRRQRNRARQRRPRTYNDDITHRRQHRQYIEYYAL